MNRYFIGPFDKNSGLQLNFKPWALPSTAFSSMRNVYNFRERIRKRFGTKWLSDSQLLSRLRIKLGTTAADGSGFTNFTSRLPCVKPDAGPNYTPVARAAIGQMFSIGTELFTVNTITPVLPATTVSMLCSGTSTGATIDVTSGGTTSGELQFNHVAASTDVYFYPSLPVIGLKLYETTNLDYERVIGFDTKFAYECTVNGWDRLSAESTDNDSIWDGATTANFPSVVNWRGSSAATKLMFVANTSGSETKKMRYFDGTTWFPFIPDLGGGSTITGCQMLVQYKGHLIALAPWIGGTQQQNSAYYSALDDPMPTTGWKQDVLGKGNYVAAPTSEAIQTAFFLKDQLIVKFEHSTRALRYRGNSLSPFYWETINSELGCESLNSIIPFDKVGLSVGNMGVTADNTMSVERIDDKIPDEVFKIHVGVDGPKRVYGIRDYVTELAYWSFPDATRSSTIPYPNRVLVYNYKLGSWAYNDDSITCFGYYYDQSTDGVTWDDNEVGWDDDTTWDKGDNQPRAKHIIAGNQQGYTFLVDIDETTNAPVLQITDISFSPDTVTMIVRDHNLSSGDYIYIQDVVGPTALNVFITPITVVDEHTISLPVIMSPVAYKGGGTISRVSNIDLKTKEYNFFLDSGRGVVVNKINFNLDRTFAGEFSIDYFTSTNVDPDGTVAVESYAYDLSPYEKKAERVWHPVWINAQGESVQLRFYLNDEQMRDLDVREAPFQLNAFIIEASPGSFTLG